MKIEAKLDQLRNLRNILETSVVSNFESYIESFFTDTIYFLKKHQNSPDFINNYKNFKIYNLPSPNEKSLKIMQERINILEDNSEKEDIQAWEKQINNEVNSFRRWEIFHFNYISSELQKLIYQLLPFEKVLNIGELKSFISVLKNFNINNFSQLSRDSDLPSVLLFAYQAIYNIIASYYGLIGSINGSINILEEIQENGNFSMYIPVKPSIENLISILEDLKLFKQYSIHFNDKIEDFDILVSNINSGSFDFNLNLPEAIKEVFLGLPNFLKGMINLGTDSKTERIKKWKELYDLKAISEEEFTIEKYKIMHGEFWQDELEVNQIEIQGESVQMEVKRLKGENSNKKLIGSSKDEKIRIISELKESNEKNKNDGEIIRLYLQILNDYPQDYNLLKDFVIFFSPHVTHNSNLYDIKGKIKLLLDEFTDDDVIKNIAKELNIENN